eukprot:3510169-Rhodomonas_salina.1
MRLRLLCMPVTPLVVCACGAFIYSCSAAVYGCTAAVYGCTANRDRTGAAVSEGAGGHQGARYRQSGAVSPYACPSSSHCTGIVYAATSSVRAARAVCRYQLSAHCL